MHPHKRRPHCGSPKKKNKTTKQITRGSINSVDYKISAYEPADPPNHDGARAQVNKVHGRRKFASYRYVKKVKRKCCCTVYDYGWRTGVESKESHHRRDESVTYSLTVLKASRLSKNFKKMLQNLSWCGLTFPRSI